VDYDLVGEPPELRSPVRYEAVREDSLDQYSEATRRAWTDLTSDAVLVLAGRGFLDDPVPLYPDPTVAGPVPVRTVPTANHYSILFGEEGASAVADLLRPE
jgi:hypothetical protein